MTPYHYHRLVTMLAPRRIGQLLMVLLVAFGMMMALSNAQESSSSTTCLVDANGECKRTESGTDDRTTTTTTATPSSPSLIETGFGVPQLVDGPHADEIRSWIHKMNMYMIQQDNIIDEGKDNKNNLNSTLITQQAKREKCKNMNENCVFWAVVKECELNPTYMKVNCAPACLSCEDLLSGKLGTTTTTSTTNADDVEEGEPIETGYGVRQIVRSTNQEETRQVIHKMEQYMQNLLHNESFPYTDIIPECKNKEDQCAYWAAIGECDKNPKYMLTNCGPACQSCEHLSFDFRCPLPDEETLKSQNFWRPGDLNSMFERIIESKEYNQSDTIILSRQQPWVVIMDNFLSVEECDKLIELGGKQGYEISRDVGPRQADGTYAGVVSAGRTSTNAWCAKDCYDDPITQQILQKMENLTGIPDANAEHLQLLRYEQGQFYERHHDYIEHDIHRGQGVRILTVFLYLNDVPAGGGTHFPRLDLTVMPKRGRVLIWPSVANEFPEMKDIRTEHEALPVLEGIKFGANAWFHQRNFKIPYDKNCI